MSVSINGSGGLTFNDNSVQSTAASGFGFKNRIINGDMRIDQRNNGALVSNANGAYGVDRMVSFFSPGTFTAQQQTGGPTGFSRFLRYTVSIAGTRNAADYYLTSQHIEGFNVADFGLGSAGASSFTLSFWVRSSIAGLYSGCINSGDNTRGYGFNFTINTANTWEQKSVTITGDTSGGTTAWPTGNGLGMYVRIDLGSGSNYQLASAGSWLVATNRSGLGGTVGWAQTAGATFDITGLTLEKGSTATSFDYRPYGTELQLCQRYYTVPFGNDTGTFVGRSGPIVAIRWTTNQVFLNLPTPCRMRATPTIASSGAFAVDGNGTAGSISSFGAVVGFGDAYTTINVTTSFNPATNVTYAMYSTTGSLITLSAEL